MTKRHSVRFFLWIALILVLLLPLTASAESENLIINPGFEILSSDQPQDWEYSSWYTDEEATLFVADENAHSGNNCVQIYNNWMNDARYQQTVSVEPDSVYHLSAWVKAETGEEGWGANLSIENTFIHSTERYDTAGEWENVDLYFRTGESQDFVTVYLRVGGYSGESSGGAWFDDVCMTLVSEDEVPAGTVIESAAMADDSAEEEKIEETEDEGPEFLWPMIVVTLASLVIVYLGRHSLLNPELPDSEHDKKDTNAALALVLIIGLAFRLILAPLVSGYPNDMACWMYWGDAMAEKGPWGFYNSDMFCDYPPLYLYVLGAFGWIRRLLGIEMGSNVHMALMKVPPILADIAACILLYHWSRKAGRRNSFALSIASLYMLMPAIWYNSACFGQIDSILALFAVLYLVLLQEERILPASVLLVLGVLTKPQMLLLAPVLLIVFIRFWQKNGALRSLSLFVRCLICGIAAGLIIIIPFWGHQKASWIVDLYLGTLGSYPYGSLSACNLMTLIGGLWEPDTTLFLGVSLKIWGCIGIGLSCVIFFIASLKSKDRNAVYLHAALLLTGIYTLGCYMHERYLFPVLLVLLVGYCLTGRKNLLIYFIWFSVTQFANTSLVLANQYLPDGHWISYLISALVLIGYILMMLDALLEAWGKMDLWNRFAVLAPAKEEKHRENSRIAVPLLTEEEAAVSASIEKKDVLPLVILTAVYAIIAFIYLGSTAAPKTYWETKQSGESVVVDLGENHASVQELWSYRGLCYDTASMDVEMSEDGEEWLYVRELYMSDHGRSGDVWRYFSDDLIIPEDMRYVRFTSVMPVYRFQEIYFRDADKQLVPIQAVLTESDRENGPACAFDEQDSYCEQESFYNATYFDEIYHARTAWEMLEGESIYETTHPPLGKIIIGLGIRLFGLTPFGWRFMGTLIGVLMIPAMFLLAKTLFRNSRYAFAAAFLMTFDFMHFVQTRIATIDSYSVFFTILMMTFMLRFLQLDYHKAPLKQIFLNLGLSGLFFGLGAASKWTCLYSGAGLAVMFFYSLLVNMTRIPKGQIRAFCRRTAAVLAWCVLVFVAIPAVIYILSYIPYMKDGFDLETVWKNQVSMLNYHSQLVDDHFFQSPWYQWPFLIKPIWFYKNNYLPAGQMGSIASFGNPLIWWTGTLSLIYLIIKCFRKGTKEPKGWWVLAAFASQFLPWTLVPRSMFIYHYFGSVPFFILAIMLLYRELEQEYPEKMKKIGCAFAIGAVLLFIAFYPVLSGMPISSAYGKLLHWMPTWYFTY